MDALFAQAATLPQYDPEKQAQAWKQVSQTPAGYVNALLFIACLVCAIIVTVRAFRKGSTAAGILSAVGLLLCCVPGFLMTFVLGWIKSGEWGIRVLMAAYTGLILAYAGTYLYLYSQVNELLRPGGP